MNDIGEPTVKRCVRYARLSGSTVDDYQRAIRQKVDRQVEVAQNGVYDAGSG
jgi:hypothetical protein